MNLKKGIAVAIVLAATASAAFLAQRQMEEGRSERLARRQKLVSTSVPVTRPPVVAGLTIDGSLIGGGGMPASATLTLRVGNAVTTQPITLSPDFSFMVTGAQASDMVSVEIQTPTYRYASLLGSYGRLLRQAGSDAHLTAAECERVQVSSLSTAMYFFIQRGLGGRLPVSDAEHERSVRSLGGEDLMTAASWLESFTQGRFILPSGFANGYELLQDRQAFRTYIANPTWGQANGTPWDVMSAPSAPIRPDQLGRTTLLLGAIPANDITTLDPGTQIISQTAAGWAVYGGNRRNPLFSPSFTPSGDLELTSKGGTATYARVLKQVDAAQPSPMVMQQDLIQRETVRQLFRGDRYSLWAVRTEWIRSYPDYPAYPPSVGGATALYVATALDALLPFRDGELTGMRTLPVPCKSSTVPRYLEHCEGAVHHLNADGSGYNKNIGVKVGSDGLPAVADGSRTFQWSNGRTGPLQVNYSDMSVSLWRIARANEAINTMVYVARAQDGQDTLTVAGLTAMVNVNQEGMYFYNVEPVGFWYYGTFKTSVPPYAYSQSNPPVDTHFERKPGGMTDRTDVIYYDPPDGPYELTVRMAWQVTDGRLYETRYRANISTGVLNTSGFYSCDSAYQRGATKCGVQQVRYFRPLAKLGNRVYGLQEVYSLEGSSYVTPYPLTRFATVTYHEML